MLWTIRNVLLSIISCVCAKAKSVSQLKFNELLRSRKAVPPIKALSGIFIVMALGFDLCLYVDHRRLFL